MFIDRIGHGPDLVLLHGWAMHGGVFAPLVERLRDHYTLHVVDLPGHGGSRDSEVPLRLETCAAAIAEQVPVDATWCGWSLGGLIALHAAQHAIPVRALVMLCATPCFVRKDDWRWGMSPEIFRDFAEGLRNDWRGTLDRFLALEAFGSEHAKEELRHLRDELFARGEPATSVLADGLELLETSDLRPGLPALMMPSLWIGGRRDRLVDPRAMQASVELTPNASIDVVDHAGHAPFLTHADAVAAALGRLPQ
ncbi:pimeloyl-ACP methyl ester esterase BioH [Solilutibacter silvestris]|uniref:pimeloyl-ACP methyl ester esterase BioH n=1 Tax=Solilutibacter silvestris TaxID=1645665 RepID=UPI000CA00FED|nr:pimeloyl-ACP methyl ester esterase BioH [Lysobacter silvestris]